ncbi:hypothetical protein J6590_034156 [Homalodisca vitripennis]|nr:hypothetical protein J6590_034156 [Homalodisca vitripennis]
MYAVCRVAGWLFTLLTLCWGVSSGHRSRAVHFLPTADRATPRPTSWSLCYSYVCGQVKGEHLPAVIRRFLDCCTCRSVPGGRGTPPHENQIYNILKERHSIELRNLVQFSLRKSRPLKEASKYGRTLKLRATSSARKLEDSICGLVKCRDVLQTRISKFPGVSRHRHVSCREAETSRSQNLQEVRAFKNKEYTLRWESRQEA